MKLKDKIINLVGFFECSIENNTFMCDGIESSVNDDNGNLLFETYKFDLLDTTNNVFTGAVLTIFNQIDDKILFLYRKNKYEVTLISDDLITFTRLGVNHFIKRTELGL